MNASSPMRVNAREFNIGAERYYRTTLRKQHIEEALGFLVQDCNILDRESGSLDESQRKALRVILQGQDAARFIENAKEDVLHERADIPTLQRLMNLVLFMVHYDQKAATQESDYIRSDPDAAPVYRAG
ncbi:MAG: hypothetical protein WCL44_15880 [bacterium]